MQGVLPPGLTPHAAAALQFWLGQGALNPHVHASYLHSLPIGEPLGLHFSGRASPQDECVSVFHCAQLCGPAANAAVLSVDMFHSIWARCSCCSAGVPWFLCNEQTTIVWVFTVVASRPPSVLCSSPLSELFFTLHQHRHVQLLLFRGGCPMT